MNILFCGHVFPHAPRLLAERLRGKGDDIRICAAESVAGELADVDVLVPLMSRVDGALMDRGRFRLIHQWGSGLEGVDIPAAAQRGIDVANVPGTGGNADSVAEHAIMLILGLLRELPAALTNVSRGLLGTPLGRMLGGRTVCLYGLGSIAHAIARRLKAFDVRILGITREPDPSKIGRFHLDACFDITTRQAALAQSDILVVCLKSSPQTVGAIDREVIFALPRGALVVNIARGAIVDYEALRDALLTGHLGGAGLDVFWREPISPNDPLLQLPNVIATPHVAGCTDRSYSQIADAFARNLEHFRRGEALENSAIG